jgi:hypothetical protein
MNVGVGQSYVAAKFGIRQDEVAIDPQAVRAR